MKRKIFLFCLLTAFPAILFGQTSVPDSLASLFHQQLMTFPQEKIYLHTDKPYYISGENIWFRAYIADAVTHVPFTVSQTVTVELINPLDSVLNRVKILNQDDVYHGRLLIPEDAPEGDYTLRAYTAFMRSQDENYFFTKNIRICDPQTRTIKTETEFEFESDKILASFRFSKTESSEPFVPQSVNVRINDGQPIEISKIDKDATANISFKFPAASNKRLILLEIKADRVLYRQFIQVPVPDNDFDVAFFPEGGNLMQGVSCRVAFKAMKSNGSSADITGVIYDQTGTEIQEFKSDYHGMGSFLHISEKDKSYYAVCKNDKGQSKRFYLPTPSEYGYALSVNQTGSRIIVSVLQPQETEQNDELYLIAHIRGMIYLAKSMEVGKGIVIRKEQSPSGVMHLILFDGNMSPVSERLVFINNNDEANVSTNPDNTRYPARSLVKKELKLTDNSGKPLAGNFSVSVTSDKEVQPDSTSSILTQLLLTSDLYGFIENPAYYFQDTGESAWALDLLMLTQGWRRYDIAALAKNRLSKPAFSIEDDLVISGTVKNILTGRSVKDLEVSAWSYNSDYFEVAKTDNSGRFSFRGNVPDSTRFVVSAIPHRGFTNTNLILDEEIFPSKTLPTAVPSVSINTKQLTEYVDKAELSYTYEHGMRTYLLPEVTIKATQTPKIKSYTYLYDPPPKSRSFTAKDIEDFPASNVFMLLSRMPGVVYRGNDDGGEILIRGKEPLLVVDDMLVRLSFLTFIDPFDIEQIEVVHNISRFGTSTIMVFLKKGMSDNSPKVPPANVKSIMPLGYQSPVEFYAPKYDTPEKRNSQTPDLRTTIHWQPVVQINNDGSASFEFYTDDESAPFTVVIEGLSNNGRIIRHEE